MFLKQFSIISTVARVLWQPLNPKDIGNLKRKTSVVFNYPDFSFLVHGFEFTESEALITFKTVFRGFLLVTNRRVTMVQYFS